jgi:hypothetical protein
MNGVDSKFGLRRPVWPFTFGRSVSRRLRAGLRRQSLERDY